MADSMRRAIPISAALLWLLPSACGPQPGAQLRLSADFEPATELTHLEITVAASSSPEGDRICEPSTRLLWLDPNQPGWVSLPLTIWIQAGGAFDRILYVRVRGYLNGMLRLQTEQMASLRGGNATLDLTLLASCIGVGTGRGQACINGVEIQSPYAPIFDKGLGVESDIACLKDE